MQKFHITEERSDICILRVRKDVMFLRGRSDMAILGVRKDVILLRQRSDMAILR